MTAKTVVEKQILEALHDLELARWFEVIDFIGYLKYRATLERAEAHRQELTARDLLHSELVGLWANRDDIGDSLSFAHQLRWQAEHRREANN